ncbi:MAG: ribonuclease Z [Euryarchaeota archaeon]|nr:ribonuclease Z [Euryarchaeota archaeon]
MPEAPAITHGVLKVTFLGTSGATPSPNRNPSAVLVSREGELLLFDCGEGTQQQMMRAKTGMRALTTLFITHFHGDHFLGIPGLVQTLSFHGRTEPLEIIGPRGIEKLVETLVTLGGFRGTFPVTGREMQPEEALRRDGYLVRAFKTEHSTRSLGVALEENPRPGRFNKPRALELGVPEGPLFGRLQRGQPVTLPGGPTVKPEEVVGPPRPGRKVVYTGDTRPCESVVEASRGADLLIHDGTLASDEAEWAREAKHSTASEAAEVAKRAGVRQLILTHLSTRYTEDPTPLLREAKAVFENSCIAEELMALEIPFRDS